jgi:glycosyltransferase involved in cell wall biosynthesis
MDREGADQVVSTTIERRGGRSAAAGQPQDAPQVSVIIPLYHEEDNVRPLHERLQAALGGLGRTYEIVYVDDGSRDLTPQRLAEIVRADPSVRVVRFRRNFGQTAAIQAGIEYSRGEVLVFMDGDLQNDPDDIAMLLGQIDDGHDVVSGWRKDRHDDRLRSMMSRAANGLISRVTGVELHDYGCTLKAYRREVLEHVRLYGEMHRFIPALVSWGGASIVELPVRHHARQHGRSKYGLSRTFRVLLDLLTVKMLASYSTKPIYVFGYAGFALWAAAFLAGLVVIAQKLLPPYPYAHNNPLLLLAVFLAIVGMQLILMGLLAELVIRAYHESQDKPTYVVREVVEGRAAQDA